jgi:predicted dehydrogenase
MTGTLRVGILGSGFMGRVHGERLAQIPDVSVTAVCNPNLKSAEALAAGLGLAGTTTYADVERMLREAPLDALYVCLPPHAHGGEVEAAAARGLHLFLEKPIALDSERAASMVRAIETNGVVSQVGYQMRFRLAVERIVRELATGSAGRPTLFQARYFCNMAGGAWWRDKTRSGGQVYEQLIHLYDLALHLLGAPATASGFIANLCHEAQPDYTIEDTSAAVLRFKSGALASIVGSNAAMKDRFIGDFRLVCENVTLDYRSTGDWRDRDRATLYRSEGDALASDEVEETQDTWLPASEDFIAAIRERRETRAPAREGLAGIRLVEAVIRSAARGGAPTEL